MPLTCLEVTGKLAPPLGGMPMLARLFLILFATSFVATGQQTAATPAKISEVSAKHARIAAAKIIPTKDFEQFVPYWTAEGGWHTELQLRNNLTADDLVVAPALRSANGVEVALNPIRLLPGEVRTISLADALTGVNSDLAGKAYAFGSIVMRYNSKASRNLYSSVMVHDSGHPIMYHLDGIIQAGDYVTGSREGIWWLPTSSTHDYLVLTNQGDRALQGTVWLYNASGKSWNQLLQLGARETLRLSVRDMLDAAGFDGQYGGIKVDMPRGAGSLDTVHLVYDETAGFSATLKMFDYDPRTKLAERDYASTGAWTIRAPMLALTRPDPVLDFPTRTELQPMLLVRNTTAKPAKVMLSFHWRSSISDGRAALPVRLLAPYETQKIDVQTLQRNGFIPLDATWAQATLATDTAPEAVMAIAASYDKTLRYGAQTPFTDQLTGHLEGGQWMVDSTHNSLIAVGNGGSKPVPIALTIFYDQGRQRYRLEKTVAPDDQWWIDVGSLIWGQTADTSGNTLPAGLTAGAYQLREIGDEPQNTIYEGKVITDKTYGHATYGCMVCCGYGGDAGKPFIVEDPTGLAVSSTTSVDVYGTNACTGNSDPLDPYFPNWVSNDTTILTASHYLVTGISIGSTKILANASRMPTGQGQDQRQACPMAPAQSVGTGSVGQKVPIVANSCSDTTRTGTMNACWGDLASGGSCALCANIPPTANIPSGGSCGPNSTSTFTSIKLLDQQQSPLIARSRLVSSIRTACSLSITLHQQ